MAEPLVLALAGDDGSGVVPTTTQLWVEPDELASCAVADSIDLESVCRVATDILFRLSARRYGVRSELLRPVAGQRSCGWSMYLGSEWQWRYQRGDRQPDWVVLKSPVREIVSVSLDGAVMDPDEYRLYDRRKLVRMPDPSGNTRLWPLFQRLDADLSQVGTFGVNYRWGQDVPEGGLAAARVFACQLAKYVAGDSDCALPNRVTSISRQGVTQTILDPSQFLKECRTGLYMPDVWLASVNPNNLRQRPRVISPDLVEQVRPI